MTTAYDATGRECINCGHIVEDYTGHLQASEVTLCSECPDELEDEKWKYRADVVHRIPRSNQSVDTETDQEKNDE